MFGVTAYNRFPRKGELNYKIQRIFMKHCADGKLRDHVKAVEIALTKLAPKFNVFEFDFVFDKHSSLNCDHPSWINYSINITLYRKKKNGSLAIHRAGCSTAPSGTSEGYPGKLIDLKARRDRWIYTSIDEPYAWENSLARASKTLKNKWKKSNQKWVEKNVNVSL